MIKKITAIIIVAFVLCVFVACADSDDEQSKTYKFVYNGAELVPGEPFADAKEILGDPTNYYESASCAFDGIDKIYTYGSVQITVSEYKDKGDCVYSIVLLDDANATPEGIYVGSNKSSVVSALGEGVDNGTSLIYTGGHTQLVLLIREDAVTSIQYRFAE